LQAKAACCEWLVNNLRIFSFDSNAKTLIKYLELAEVILISFTSDSLSNENA